MCLTVKENAKPKIAKRDIVCYKVLLKRHNLFTPYREAPVEIGFTHTSKLVIAVDEVHIGLHSFKYYKDLKAEIGYWQSWSDADVIVAKCVIPEGCKYYAGVFDSVASYASDTISYLEILT